MLAFGVALLVATAATTSSRMSSSDSACTPTVCCCCQFVLSNVSGSSRFTPSREASLPATFTTRRITGSKFSETSTLPKAPSPSSASSLKSLRSIRIRGSSSSSTRTSTVASGVAGASEVAPSDGRTFRTSSSCVPLITTSCAVA